MTLSGQIFQECLWNEIKISLMLFDDFVSFQDNKFNFVTLTQC